MKSDLIQYIAFKFFKKICFPIATKHLISGLYMLSYMAFFTHKMSFYTASNKLVEVKISPSSQPELVTCLELDADPFQVFLERRPLGMASSRESMVY